LEDWRTDPRIVLLTPDLRARGGHPAAFGIPVGSGPREGGPACAVRREPTRPRRVWIQAVHTAERAPVSRPLKLGAGNADTAEEEVCLMRKLAFFVSFSFSLVACSSTVRYTIMTSDPRARILVDGHDVGQGTVFTELQRDCDHAVLAQAPDGRAASAKIRYHRSALGKTALALCWMYGVPLLLLLAPQSYSLTPETLAIVLPPPEPASTATVHLVPAVQ